MYKEVIQEELMQGDVNTLLEQPTKMVDSTHETVIQLRARLMKAAAAINEEEWKKKSKGEKQKESVETADTVRVVCIDV